MNEIGRSASECIMSVDGARCERAVERKYKHRKHADLHILCVASQLQQRQQRNAPRAHRSGCGSVCVCPRLDL